MLRRTRSHQRLNSQRGMSLVELMVGVVLSMITVLAAMSAYKSLIHNSLTSQANSKAQNISAALSVQLSRLLPQAGWGVGATATPAGGAVDKDVVLLANASISGSDMSGTATPIGTGVATGNAVVWDSALSGSVQCSALVIPRAGGLVLLGPVPCANAEDWGALDWPDSTTLLPADALPAAAFTAQKAGCWPYAAIAGGQSAVKVTLTGTKSIATTACLTNITN